MTLMGIQASKENIDLTGLKSDITKVMVSGPRKISEIHINFVHPNLQATEVQKQKLKNAAHTCPVALSISDGIKQVITFNF